MQVTRIVNSNGVDDLKLIAENDIEQNYLRQLATAGTLTSISASTGLSLLLRAVSVMEEDYSSNTATVSNSIGRYNFDIRQNERKVSDMLFTINGAAMNLTVYDSIILQVKKHKAGSAVITLNIGEGLELMGDSHNVLRLTFTALQTALLDTPQYYYDILCKTGSINSYNVEGIINVIPSVSR